MREKSIRTTGIETTYETPERVQELMDPSSTAYDEAVMAQDEAGAEELRREMRASGAAHRAHAAKARALIAALELDEVA